MARPLAWQEEGVENLHTTLRACTDLGQQASRLKQLSGWFQDLKQRRPSGPGRRCWLRPVTHGGLCQGSIIDPFVNPV